MQDLSGKIAFVTGASDGIGARIAEALVAEALLAPDADKTRAAALDYAEAGIRVNAIGPGYVDTPRMRQTPPEMLDLFAQSSPMRRLASRDEVASFVLFLLSEQSAFCTGGFYPVDGGFTAQ